MSNFERDEIVWAKIKGYPWWPAMIYNITYQQNNLTKYSIQFIEEKSTAEVTEEKLGKFIDKLEQFEHKYSKPALQKSIEEAKQLYMKKYKLDNLNGVKNNNKIKTGKEEVHSPRFLKKANKKESFDIAISEESNSLTDSDSLEENLFEDEPVKKQKLSHDSLRDNHKSQKLKEDKDNQLLNRQQQQKRDQKIFDIFKQIEELFKNIDSMVLQHHGPQLNLRLSDRINFELQSLLQKINFLLSDGLYCNNILDEDVVAEFFNIQIGQKLIHTFNIIRNQDKILFPFQKELIEVHTKISQILLYYFNGNSVFYDSDKIPALNNVLQSAKNENPSLLVD